MSLETRIKAFVPINELRATCDDSRVKATVGKRADEFIVRVSFAENLPLAKVDTTVRLLPSGSEAPRLTVSGSSATWFPTFKRRRGSCCSARGLLAKSLKAPSNLYP